jgi:hypothetical protein
VREWQDSFPWVYVDFLVPPFCIVAGGILSSRMGGLVPSFHTPSYDMDTPELVPTLFL